MSVTFDGEIAIKICALIIEVPNKYIQWRGLSFAFEKFKFKELNIFFF